MKNLFKKVNEESFYTYRYTSFYFVLEIKNKLTILFASKWLVKKISTIDTKSLDNLITDITFYNALFTSF